MLTPKGVFSKNNSFPSEKIGFFGSKASKLRAKTDQKSIKNGVQDGMHLGIDFEAIVVDFWYQVGVENRSKINQK